METGDDGVATATTVTTTDRNIQTEPTAEIKSKVAEAHESSTGCIDFILVFLFLVFGTVGCTILTAVAIGIPIAMIVIGVVHRKNCPASPHIAIWLIEWGVMTLARKSVFLITHDKSSKQQKRKVLYGSLDLLIGWWSLIGGLLIFDIYKPNYENTLSKNYCHPTLYKFSFYIVIFAVIGFIFSAVLKILKFCKISYRAHKRKQEKKISKIRDIEAGEVAITEMTSTTTDGNVETPNTSKSAKTAKFKEAKTTSSGCIDFCFIFSVVTLGTVGCTIITILLFGLPISMIVIGGIHKDHCKGSPHLAIWLIQYGVMLLARQCAFLVSKDKTYKEQRNTGVYSTLDLLIGWWPLIGGILTFGIDQSETINEESPTYCHYTLYKFSFFLVIFAIIGLVCTALGKIYDLCKGFVSEKKAKGKTDVEAGETEEMKS